MIRVFRSHPANPAIAPDAIIRDVQVNFDSTPLGRGSDAVVYEGSWKTPVAVKVLHEALIAPDVQSRDVFIARFLQECKRMEELRHINIVQFLGVMMTRSGAPALVTEKMAKTLEKHYETTELSLPEAVRIFCDISAGLACIHAHGMVHRDLTTRNVLLTSETKPRAKIADVGVSRRLHGDNLAAAAALTKCPGTLLYMPPEALTDPPTYDERLDSFSLGVLMMAVLLKREPSGDLLHIERFERLADGSRRAIPEVERRKADFDAIGSGHPLKGILGRCLVNDGERRPSAAQLHLELVSVAESLDGLNKPQRVSFYCVVKCNWHLRSFSWMITKQPIAMQCIYDV